MMRPSDSLVGAMNPCAAALLEPCISQAGVLFDHPLYQTMLTAQLGGLSVNTPPKDCS